MPEVFSRISGAQDSGMFRELPCVRGPGLEFPKIGDTVLFCEPYKEDLLFRVLY